jgi:tight adherence protein B
MSLVVGILAGAGILAWPERFDRRRVAILPGSSNVSVLGGWGAGDAASGSVHGSAAGQAREPARERVRRRLSGRPAGGVDAHDLLGLLEAIAPALEAGMAPAAALRITADARLGSGQPDPLAVLASDIALAAAGGAALGPLWREAAVQADSPELQLLSQAWSLTEDMGVPLAQAVRTTAGLLEARIAHERRLAGAVAGARATVNVLTVLPVGGPLLGLVLGIGPGELYGGSRLTQISLMLGLALAGVGRWWVRRMVRAVARGPVLA